MNLRGIGIAFALLTTVGCADDGVQCTEIACDGGFDLWITSVSPTEAFVAGSYEVHVQVGGGELEVECEVATDGTGTCDQGRWRVDPTEEIRIETAFGVPVSQAVIDDLAIQVHFEGISDAGAGTNLYGPTELELEIERDNRTEYEGTLTPTYERDEMLNGPPECGFCDSREREIVRL